MPSWASYFKTIYGACLGALDFSSLRAETLGEFTRILELPGFPVHAT